jgi:molybdopterin biosynthesis enzyme MoaB
MATVGASADQGGAGAERLAQLLVADGHVVYSQIDLSLSQSSLASDREALDVQLGAWCNHPEIDTIMVLGGIGLSARDITTDAVSQRVTREAVGFGESVRRLSSTVMPLGALSLRAMAGVGPSTLLFALPDHLALIELLYPVLIGPLCDAGQAGSLAALVPALRAVG